MPDSNGVTLEDAQGLIEAALAWAREHELPMAVAVVDRGGHPVAMARLDGASILASETVIQDARSAAWLGRPTASAVEIGRQWPHVYLSFVAASQGSFTITKGAYPIVRDGEVLGAMSASGGTGDQDAACTLAALRAGGYVADPGYWPSGPGTTGGAQTEGR